MRIEFWMKYPVHTVRPLDSVAHARALLEKHRINQLPVTVNGRLVGIVTDRDLRDAVSTVSRSAAAAGGGRAAPPDPREIRTRDVMTANVLTLKPSDKVERAAELMMRERIGAVPIVERNRLVGILARSDILGGFLLLAQRTDSEDLKPAMLHKPGARTRARNRR